MLGIERDNRQSTAHTNVKWFDSLFYSTEIELESQWVLVKLQNRDTTSSHIISEQDMSGRSYPAFLMFSRDTLVSLETTTNPEGGHFYIKIEHLGVRLASDTGFVSLNKQWTVFIHNDTLYLGQNAWSSLLGEFMQYNVYIRADECDLPMQDDLCMSAS